MTSSLEQLANLAGLTFQLQSTALVSFALEVGVFFFFFFFLEKCK